MGQGPPLILVDGALCSRSFGPSPKLGPLLARNFTVFTYDRRGRGESSDTKPYAVEREIEDLEALVEKAGGPAFAFGVSSGAALVLFAAAQGLPFQRIALYEAPFMVDPSAPQMEEVWPRIDKAVEEDLPSEAVKLFLHSVGVPPPIVALMRLFPLWSKLKAVAHTLPYDGAIVKPYQKREPLPRDKWASVEVPAMVLDGDKSSAWMRNATQSLSEILPKAQYHSLAGQGHDAAKAAPVLVPILEKFFV